MRQSEIEGIEKRLRQREKKERGMLRDSLPVFRQNKPKKTIEIDYKVRKYMS